MRKVNAKRSHPVIVNVDKEATSLYRVAHRPFFDWQDAHRVIDELRHRVKKLPIGGIPEVCEFLVCLPFLFLSLPAIGASHTFANVLGPTIGSREPVLKDRNHNGDGQKCYRRAADGMGGPVNHEALRSNSSEKPPCRRSKRGNQS